MKGLSLQVTKAGVKSWLLRYEIAGRERWMGLGPIDLISLKEARIRARAARVQLLDGVDPLEAKKQKKVAAALEQAKTVTFDVAAREYYDVTKASWRSARTGAQFQSSLKAYVLRDIGQLPVAAIDKALVLKVIRPLWADKTETMDRVRRRIEAVLDFAAVSGYRPEGDNPARWEGHLEHVLPSRHKIQKTKPLAALPYVELPAFMVRLRAREGVAARALEFTILTCVRTAETLGANWAEIDIKNRTWTIRPERMKKGREHRVPLSDRALEILNALPRDGNLVFDLDATAMLRQLRQLGCSDTVHGLRSTFRDWGAETETGYPSEMFEMALAHKVGTATELAYRRGDQLQKRHKLMADWSRYCSTPVGVVVPLRVSS